MAVSRKDREVLRRLAGRLAEIAALPVQQQTAERWRRLNALRPDRPMVWIDEVPWHEMDVDGDLVPRTEDPFWHPFERQMRRTLYQWRHMRVDMVVEDVIYSPLAIRWRRDFGIRTREQIARIDRRSNVVSHAYINQIRTEADVRRIRTPEVFHDEAESRRTFERLSEVFDGILRVEPRGVAGMWFAPWDVLVTWWRPQRALMDLALKPDLVHAAIERLVDAFLGLLGQYEELGLLSLNNGNVRVGSGGPGFSDELPQPDCNPGRVRPIDQWGCATAQIFSDVSPQMHEEFAVRYERRWLERFGLTYYGCCEPLHHKISILRSIPNLRKISMSPWADVERGAEQIADRYVFSYKPNPAILGTDVWSPDLARQELRRALGAARGCAVEIIMKDISTVHYEPRRLWEWAQIATEEAEAG